jgi:hypothetical protein
VYTKNDPISTNIDEGSNPFLFVSSNFNGLDDVSNMNSYIKSIINYIISFLSPVSVDYSNALLSEQHHGIAILLFILCLCIIVLFIAFTFNVLILLFREKIMGYFTNKYILAYLNLNVRILFIEVFILSATILFFLINLTSGLHFLATHPIVIS